jgi:hypothetical protein
VRSSGHPPAERRLADGVPKLEAGDLDPHPVVRVARHERGRLAPAAAHRDLGRAGVGELRGGAGNVLHAKGDVMDALAVLAEVGGDRALIVERFYELDEGAARVKVGEAYVRRLDLLRARDLEAQPPAEVLERQLGVGNGDADVIDAAKGRQPGRRRASILASATARTADDWAWCKSISATPSSASPRPSLVALR